MAVRLIRVFLLAILLILMTGGSLGASSQDEVLVWLNQTRLDNGLAPLTWNYQLTVAAQEYAEYLAATGFFGHRPADGSSPATRAKSAGYNSYYWGEYVGENLSRGYSQSQVIGAWWASPDHRANLLNEHFRDVGIGIANSPQGLVIVNDYGSNPEDGGW